jgi:hypothetical protein
MKRKLRFGYTFAIAIGLISSSLLFAQDIETGLVAYWNFNEGIGIIAYDSAGTNDGNLVGDPEWIQGPPTYGHAIALDGSDWIDCGTNPNLAITRDITISFWIKVDELINPYTNILSKGNDSYKFQVRYPNSEIVFDCNIGRVSSVHSISDGKWHHVVGVYDYDYNGLRLYFDGSEEANQYVTGEIKQNSHPLLIGANEQIPDSEMNLMIDEVRIYNRALSAVDILGLCPYKQLDETTTTWGRWSSGSDPNWTEGPYLISEDQGAPSPFEGNGILKFIKDIPDGNNKNASWYFKPKGQIQNLSDFAALRFRVRNANEDGLQKGDRFQIWIQDSSDPTKKVAKWWKIKSLEERSQDPNRWSEFKMYFDTPINTTVIGGEQIDWSKINAIYWKVIPNKDDPNAKRCFYLDGVQLLEPRTPSGMDPNDLCANGYAALFSKEAGYELIAIRTPNNTEIPVTTSMQILPLSTAPADCNTIELGGEIEIIDLDESSSEFRVKYQKGDFLHENTYKWEEGCLRILRYIKARRGGLGIDSSRFHNVYFPAPLSTYVYEYGSKDPDTGFPDPNGMLPVSCPNYPLIDLPGNWFAAYDPNGYGVAAIFPRRQLHRFEFGGRQFSIVDIHNFNGYWLPDQPTAELSYSIWIAPIEPNYSVPNYSPSQNARSQTKRIGKYLTETKDYEGVYFPWAHRGFSREHSTLIHNSDFAMWETSAIATVPFQQQPPGSTVDCNEISLSLARGETEPVHLVIHARKNMQNVSVICSSLKQGANEISKDYIFVRYPGYIRIQTLGNIEQPDPRKDPNVPIFVGEICEDLNEVGINAGKYYGGKAAALGWIEDPIFDPNSGSVDIAEGHNQPVWLTISAPDDVLPGTYRGEISILENGLLLAPPIPILVKVWAFRLPPVTWLRTWFQVGGDFDEDEKDNWPGKTAYYMNLASHKVSGIGQFFDNMELIVNGDNSVEISNWSDFEDRASAVLDELGMKHFKLPLGKRGGGHDKVYTFPPDEGYDVGDPNFIVAFTDYLSDVSMGLEERGYFKGTDWYIFDEPDVERIEVVRQIICGVNDILPGILNQIRVFTAASRDTNGLVGIVNAWCPKVPFFGLPYGDFSPERVKVGRQYRNDVYWWYNMTDNSIGSPIVTHRALPLATWKADVDGYFVWSVNNTFTEFQVSFEKMILDQVGQEMVLYPGKYGPIDSIRWEQTRDGLEDYDYLVILEKAVGLPTVPEDLATQGKQILDRVRNLFLDPRCLIGVNPNELKLIRYEIGELLDKLTREYYLPFVCDFNFDEKIDMTDFKLIQEHWLETGPSIADLTPDGGDEIVNLFDFALVARYWLVTEEVSLSSYKMNNH